MDQSQTKSKTHLIGKTPAELETLMQEAGYKPYRGRQLYSWLYKNREANFNNMTDIPADLREYLRKNARIDTLIPVKKFPSADGTTVKYLFELSDGNRIESVLMQMETRNTVCVSTQVGCALGCAFCATGKLGFKRNLTAGEIIEQYMRISRNSQMNISNVVFMGMGEPLLNYENVLQSAGIFTDQKGLDLAQRHITISTAGIIPGIEQFIKEGHKYKLAISLNATDNDLRSRLMPVNRKYPLEKLLSVIQKYTRKQNKTVTFEYIHFPGMNDSPDDARRLADISRKISAKFNLIPYNSTDDKSRSTEYSETDKFWLAVKQYGLIVNIRESKGQDVAAACGQLAAKEQAES